MEYEGWSSSSNITLSKEVLVKSLKRVDEAMEAKNYAEKQDLCLEEVS